MKYTKHIMLAALLDLAYISDCMPDQMSCVYSITVKPTSTLNYDLNYTSDSQYSVYSNHRYIQEGVSREVRMREAMHPRRGGGGAIRPRG